MSILYRSRNLLILYSLEFSVALFSAPVLLLVEPHCHAVRHAANPESARISYPAILQTYTRHLITFDKITTLIWKKEEPSNPDVDASTLVSPPPWR